MRMEIEKFKRRPKIGKESSKAVIYHEKANKQIISWDIQPKEEPRNVNITVT